MIDEGFDELTHGLLYGVGYILEPLTRSADLVVVSFLNGLLWI